MSNETINRDSEGRRGRFDWIFEVLVFATVTPALVYGVLMLNELPVV